MAYDLSQLRWTAPQRSVHILLLFPLGFPSYLYVAVKAPSCSLLVDVRSFGFVLTTAPEPAAPSISYEHWSGVR